MSWRAGEMDIKIHPKRVIIVLSHPEAVQLRLVLSGSGNGHIGYDLWDRLMDHKRYLLNGRQTHSISKESQVPPPAE